MVYGGCLAAGRGLCHIGPSGNLEPCPVSPYSDVNLQSTGLREGLQSPLFRAIQAHSSELVQVRGSCVLWENRAWVSAQVQQDVTEPRVTPAGGEMQYWKPEGQFYVGDCMPFFHEGVFHLYWLLDEGHHQALGGLGGHQWAHASSTDLVHWEHHPLAIAITEPWEGSICTGSTLYHEGTYYAFYATRRPDRTQHLSLATSPDGIQFAKQQPNPWLVPPAGYSPLDFRDPHVFRDPETGLFHLLVTARLDPAPVAQSGGCLAHYVSSDLRAWQPEAPFIVPDYAGVPECPDWFQWNNWYYLVFSEEGIARYRMSRHPVGVMDAASRGHV